VLETICLVLWQDVPITKNMYSNDYNLHSAVYIALEHIAVFGMCFYAHIRITDRIIRQQKSYGVYICTLKYCINKYKAYFIEILVYTMW